MGSFAGVCEAVGSKGVAMMHFKLMAQNATRNVVSGAKLFKILHLWLQFIRISQYHLQHIDVTFVLNAKRNTALPFYSVFLYHINLDLE